MIKPRLIRLDRMAPLLAFLLTPWISFSGILAAAPVDSGVRPASDAPQDLLYFTRLASPGTEYAWDIAVDGAGNSYIAGMTDSAGLAGVTNVHIVSPGGGFDAFVIKLAPDGTMAYATRIGGSLLDQASRIAVDAAGNAYIAGYTFSSDFPTTPGAYDRTYNGGDIDSFVARLSPDGTQLAYSTFLGGDSDDYGGGITVDADGQAFVTGYTESRNFPTSPGAFDTTHNGVSDVFAVRLDTTGTTLVYSTFVGGSGIEIGYDIAVDPGGHAYLTGQTTSSGFPTTPGSFSPIYNGGQADAFVVKFAPDAGALDYSTYLGGDQFDDARGIAIDAEGNAFVAGRTDSLNFPTTDAAYDEGYNGGRDAFVTKLTADGAGLGYSTYVGGTAEEESGGIALGPGSLAFVTGWTISTDFPTTPDAYDLTQNGDYDAFALALSTSGSRLSYSTFVGTPKTDYGRGIVADGSGNAYVAGYTGSVNVNAFGLKLGLGAK